MKMCEYCGKEMHECTCHMMHGGGHMMMHGMHDGHMMHGGHMMHMMHGMHMTPGMDKKTLAMMGLAYFCMHAEPIAEYACMQVQREGTKCAIKEAALLGLLIGMGYSHEDAHMVVDSWKRGM